MVEQFARLTHADPERVWGYVTNGGTEDDIAHIVTMPHVDRARIDGLIEGLHRSAA